MDTGIKYSRPVVVTSLTLLSLALSLPYCTEFGYWLLDGVDLWTNNVALVFVVWSECVTSTTVYRWRDVEGQVGKISFILYQIAFFAGQIFGVAIGQGVSAWAGAVTGFAIYIVFTVAAMVLAKTPDIRAPWIFGSNPFLAKFFYLAFYSGEQLRRDLNVIVGTGKNWNIPVIWGPLVKYVSGPILAIVYSFSYPNFINSGSPLSGKTNPLHIMGFGVGHIVLLVFLGGFMVPRWFDVFIPPNRRNEGHIPYAPMVTQDPDEMNQGVESGQAETETDAEVMTKQASPDAGSLTGDAKGAPPAYATSAERS